VDSSALIKNAAIVGLEHIERGCTVLIEQGKIVRVGPQEQFEGACAHETVDAEGKYLAGGYIDLHIHGLHHWRIEKGPKDLAAICAALPQYGVTGFLPTLFPRRQEGIVDWLCSLAAVRTEGAQRLGFHMEGPFVKLTGAAVPEALGKADPDMARALVEAAKPYRVIFSVSPELDGITELLAVVCREGTPAFTTHTAANVEQTQAAIEAGVRHATHFYDVFPCPAEREGGVRPCGVVEAVLADTRVSVDFILDGVHVEPIAVKMALQCKGPDRVCLITDANMGAALAPGRYVGIDGDEIEFSYPGGPARLTENSHEPGALAGSGLTLDAAVRNAVKLLGVDIPQAVRMASANPAKVLGLDDRKGQIKSGYDADMVLLDESLQVVRCWVAGRCYGP